jgi:DNA repair protein RecO (recombination protein O)
VLTYFVRLAEEATAMALLTTEALVLRAYDLGETSKVVVFLTRERGKLRAVAKGARGAKPRYRSALEPLSEVSVSLYGRQGTDLFRLGECDLLRSAFATGSRDLETSLFLSYAAELLDAFALEGEAEDKLYRLALVTLRATEARTPLQALSRYLEAWLLRLHGLYPPLDQCSACSRTLPPGRRSYDRASHGFVCDDCGPASGPVIPEGVCSFLGDVFRRAPTELGGPLPAEAGVLEPFHHDLISRHLERALRSERVLRDVAREVGR